MSCNSIVLVARSSRDLGFLSSWFFVVLFVVFFVITVSQNRNSKKGKCVFHEATWVVHKV